jgi:spore coat polysaccharide biosynthesis predicted glycosyltransferase SpsG
VRNRSPVDPWPRLAVRSDGGAENGAGHVARCLPVAKVLASLGWSVTFVGRYGGLAAWLLDRAGCATESPVDGPCGLAPERWTAAIIDSYDFTAPEVCAVAQCIPLATLAEAQRCETNGVLVDYHLDRLGEQPTVRVLPGPQYAPLDPGFAGAGRAGPDVETVLITVGGSTQALSYLPDLQAIARRSFPEASQLVPRGKGSRRGPVLLSDLVHRVDLAVPAAGLTSYELACAGVPQVASPSASTSMEENALRSSPTDSRCCKIHRFATSSLNADAQRSTDLVLPASPKGCASVGASTLQPLAGTVNHDREVTAHRPFRQSRTR